MGVDLYSEYRESREQPIALDASISNNFALVFLMTIPMKFYLLLALSAIACGSLGEQVLAQGIVGNGGTQVQGNGQSFEITGGVRAGNNLFQSFEKFGLKAGEVANFQTAADVANLLTRVTGGEASVINGRLQITGSNANFYLLNPAGVLFGPNASLNLPAAFTVTTGNGIRLGDEWFGIANDNFQNLSGTPNTFAFLGDNGAIVNAANLSLKTGQSFTLLGGTIVNTGSLNSPEGTVTIAAIPGQRLVQVSSAGSLLSLTLRESDRDALSTRAIAPSLAELLTGGGLGNATGVTVEGGEVRLVGSGQTILAGDAVASGKIGGDALQDSKAERVTIQGQTAVVRRGEIRARAVAIQSSGDVLITDSQIDADRDLIISGNRISVAGTAESRLASGRDLTVQSQAGGDVILQDITLNADRNLALLAPNGSLTLQNLKGTAAQAIDLDGSLVNLDGVALSASQTFDATGRDITITNSQLQSQGAMTIQSESTIYVGESALRSRGNLQILADGSNGLLTIADTAEKPITIDSGDRLRLEGNSLVEIWISTNSESTIHSVNDLDVLSSGPIYVDAKTLSPNNIRFQNPDAEPGRLIYSPSATGGSIKSDRLVPLPVDPPPVNPPPVNPPPVSPSPIDSPMPPGAENPDPLPPPPTLETAPLPPLPELNRVSESAAPAALQADRSKPNNCAMKGLVPVSRRSIACPAQQERLLRQVQLGETPQTLPPQPSR
jgi:filamentous hemagglutinin family protein